MYPEAINEQTRAVLEKIGQSPVSSQFYLAGETALAFYLGHRESIDLDFFSKDPFSNQEIKDHLSLLGQFKLDHEEEGTIIGSLDAVKIAFFKYSHPLLMPPNNYQGVSLASEQDIAAMKIDAVSSRGSKKDFIDIYFLLEKYPINELIGFFEKKYSGIQYNKLHILKSMIYFDDADQEPEPVMLKEFNWTEAKKTIEAKVKKYLQ